MKYPLQIRIPDYYIKRKIAEFLLEDAPQGDLTTCGTIDSTIKSTARVIAQENLVFAGEQLIENFFEEPFIVEKKCVDGQNLSNGDVIAVIKGPSDKLLTRERVFLNHLQRLCGIATHTRKYVDIGKPYNVKILDTRKTTPGLRFFEKFAVAVAGGFNHRLDLSSGILIKDNHIKAAGSISNAVIKVKAKNYGLPIEVEVENMNEIKEAIDAGADGLLLDNMPPAQVQQSVEFIRAYAKNKDVYIEASGGINLDTLPDYVVTGVDAVSVGALTHSIKSSEIHMEFD